MNRKNNAHSPVVPLAGYCHTCHRTARERAAWRDAHCYASDCPARMARDNREPSDLLPRPPGTAGDDARGWK